MPKIKHRAEPKSHKVKQMDKVKIKRVKRTHKTVSTKEKILGGLGLGSTLIGGVGAISASSQPQTQFVRTNETEKNSSASKIKSVLNKVFGVKTAQAAMTAEQDAARQMLATGQNPDGSPATQEQLSNANEIYYGGYYNQLPNVGSNYTPEELQNIGAQGLAGAHVIRDGQGNFMGAVNRVGDTIVVTLSNGGTETFTIAQALQRMGVAANDTAKNLLILSRDDGYLATIGVVASTSGSGTGTGTGTGGTGTVTTTVQVTGVVSIFDENGNETARQGNYSGNRYALAGGVLYDGNGQPVTNLSDSIINQIIEQITSQNPGFAIITDANGNPLSVWDAQGTQITGTTAESILNSYHTGTQLHFSAPSVPGGSVGTQTPPVTPPVVNPLNSISSTTVQVTPGQYGQSWSTEGVTQAYNKALAPFQLITQRNNQTGQVINYTITLNNGTTKTFTPTELNSFLNSTWNGGQFMNLSLQDQQIFVAAIQARLQDPNIGLGIPNLPSPNTNDAQAIHFIDSNGNLINFQQGFSPTGQSFRADAEWVQKMFPGSRIVDSGFPGGTTSSWNPVDSGDPRGYYQLVLPNGESFNIGLFLQGNLEQSNGKTIVTITPEQAKYFTAPTNNFISSVIGTATGGTTGGTGAGTTAATTTTQTDGQITTSSLPAGIVGTSYNQGISAYNVSATPRTWAIASGQLPAGLSLNSSTGFISGTPTQAGNYNFTLRVTFSNNQTAQKSFNVVISGSNISIVNTNEASGLNAWVSETAASLRVGESKTISTHVADGDAVLVGANKFTATSSNLGVATVSAASDSNSVVITGRSVGSATIRIHPSGRADTAGDRVIMVTVVSASTTTTTTTTTTTGGNNNSSLYPAPSSSGGGGSSGIVTGSIFNQTGSGFTTLPENTGNTGNANGQITLVRSSVSDVGDDEGPGESTEVSSGSTAVLDSITNVGDDEDVEGSEVENTQNSITNVGDDEDVEANEVADSAVTDTDAEIEYNEVGTSSEGGNSGDNNSSGQTVANLQQQVGQLQGRINALNSQVASAQSSGSSATNIQPYLEQINQLQLQVNSLNATISRLQSGSGVRVFNNSTGLLQYADIVPKNQTAGESVSAGTYTVKKGDSLWKISQKYYGTGTKWRTILEANPQSLSKPGNVRTLRIGYVLTIPSLSGQTAGQSTVKTFEAQPPASQARAEAVIQTFEQSATQQNSSEQIANISQTQSAGQNNTQTSSGVNTRGNTQSQIQDVVYKDSISDVRGDDDEVEVKE